MQLRLRPFPADLAGVVSGWATTEEEVVMWCGRPAAISVVGECRRDGRAGPCRLASLAGGAWLSPAMGPLGPLAAT